MDYPELLKGYKNELVRLQEILLKERENREIDEQNVTELLTQIKEKYDQRFAEQKSGYEEKISKLEQQIEELNEHQEQLQNKLKDEQSFNQQLLDNEQELKQQQIELQQNLSIQQQQMQQLKLDEDSPKKQERRQTRSTQSKDEQKPQVDHDLLESKLIELEECRREIKELQFNVTHKDNEISNLKFDLRMAKRDTNSDSVKYYREANKELREKVSALENELKEYQFNQTKNEAELKSLKGMCEEYKEKNEQLQEKISSFKDEKQKLTDEITNLKCAIKSKDEAIAKHRSTNLKLKEVLASQEKQIEKYQELWDELMIEKDNLMTKNSQQIEEISSLNVELEKCKSQLKQVEEKESGLEKENNELFKRINDLESQLENEQEDNLNYLEEIKRMQQEYNDKDYEIKKNENRVRELIRELNEVKEERSSVLTELEEYKKQSYSIAMMYDDMSKNYKVAKSRILTLQDDIDKKTSEFDKEKVKSQETIAQQSKLIDHLNELLEKANTAKKPWFGLGKCDTDCKSPNTFTPKPKKTKEENDELESALQREKQYVRTLRQRIQELERLLNNKRKSEHVDENKKVVKTTATAPSINEDETTSVKSIDLQSDKTNFKSTMAKRASIAEAREEEFTFTDSIMEELAYKDD